MKKKLLACIVLLAACQSIPPRIWYRDGARVDATPAMLSQFQRDKTICDGEAAQAALTSNERDVFIHNRNLNLIFDACLTKKGYEGRTS